jgi:uncharacterized repeat protein (TIGR03803 family)
MSSSGKPFYAYRFRAMELVLQFLIGFLFLASACPVGAQQLQTLYSFTNGVGGSVLTPSGLTLGNDGNFYGTTENGGSQDNGTVFQVTTNKTLTMWPSFVNFANSVYGSPNPNPLVLGSDGSFYGTTSGGHGYGAVFRVTTNGTLTVLASFSGTNGVNPSALLLGSDGNFYGTTSGGGITNSLYPGQGMGTVFQVTTNGTLSTLVSFNLTNGAFPSGLTLGSDGNFYGTTQAGGNTNLNGGLGFGTLFESTTNGTLTTLVSFNATNAVAPNGLAQGNDGNFYGTTQYGGGTDGVHYGTIFQMTTNGTLTTLDTLTNYGANPSALRLGNDGNFYGTTAGGQGYGTAFQVMTNGAVTTLAYFNFTNGANPNGLTLGNDGNFYGTTEIGGISNSTYTSGMGTVFRLLVTPLITLQPRSQTNYEGATVTFSVSATSFEPMGYQWLRNGTNLTNGGSISGAMNASLTISGIADSDAATYSVIVTNAEGSVTSTSASLTVVDSLFIPTQPLSQKVGAGSMVIFTATAYGEPPFVFQWSFNRTPIGSPTTGTNFSSYTLNNVGTNQSGNYAVEVFNPLGSLTSSNAALTVIPQPGLAMQILAGYPVLDVQGTLGNNFIVQYSTNIADTNWMNLLSLTNLSTSPYQFLDPAGIGQPARFYRAFFTQ